jgi:hypothetical protein
MTVRRFPLRMLLGVLPLSSHPCFCTWQRADERQDPMRLTFKAADLGSSAKALGPSGADRQAEASISRERSDDGHLRRLAHYIVGDAPDVCSGHRFDFRELFINGVDLT